MELLICQDRLGTHIIFEAITAYPPVVACGLTAVAWHFERHLFHVCTTEESCEAAGLPPGSANLNCKMNGKYPGRKDTTPAIFGSMAFEDETVVELMDDMPQNWLLNVDGKELERERAKQLGRMRGARLWREHRPK